MQTQKMMKTHEGLYTTFSGSMRNILRQEGVSGLLLPGLGASVLRELSYSSIRLGIYPLIKRAIGSADATTGDVGLGPKMAAGLLAGCIGSAVANPTDRVKIQIQQEAGVIDPKTGRYVTGLAKGNKPLYPNTLSAFSIIYRKEGWGGLYRGTGPTVIRAGLLTMGQLAAYDHSKHIIKTYDLLDEGFPLHVSCAIIAAFVANSLCAPADLIKTRVMADDGTLYKGTIDCLIKTVRGEGFRALYIGFQPSLYRLLPHFILTFPLYERVRRLFGLEYL